MAQRKAILFLRACRSTDPMLTDQGMCRTINSADMSEIFSHTEYMDTFLENLIEQTNNSLRNFMIRGYGSSFSIRLILDPQDYMHE